FRDMTRIAAGHPGIWPDICTENRDAIVASLDGLLDSLQGLRAAVNGGDRDGLLRVLETARTARVNLPATVARAEELAGGRVPIPDKPGAIGEVTTLAAQLGVNIVDIEVAHSSEGDRGVLVLVIDAKGTDLLRGGLVARGYRAGVRPLGETK